MWDPKAGVLYAQVGIGSGSDRLGIFGDHDVWRLPEADDAANPPVGSPDYFISHRPLFAANRAGPADQPQPGRPGRGRVRARRRSSRLATRSGRRSARPGQGRRAAGRRQDPRRRRPGVDLPERLLPGEHLGRRHGAGHDRGGDGRPAAARPAGRAAGSPPAQHWARIYIAGTDHDSLNLYDTSALAHAELAERAHRRLTASGAARQLVVADLQRQLDTAVARAAHDPFGSAAIVTDYDAVSHELGLVATAELYAAGHRLARVRRVRGPAARLGLRGQRLGHVVRDR